MTVTRKNVEFAKRVLSDRVGNDYVYGGNWNPFNLSVGTDCSGLVIDVCDAARNGTAMAWTRHGMSTESWRPPSMDGRTDPTNGPFGTVMVNHPSQFPPDAAVKIAIHHGPGGGANSHTWCEIDGMRGESNGSDGCVTGNQARDVYDTSYANNWWYLPGPIAEDGTPVPDPAEPRDTLYADVSEWQVPVNDSYPYSVLCIRSNDGTYRDKDWATNHDWCKRNADNGKLKFFIVYFVWRPDWQNAVYTLMSQVGTPHSKMAVMIDVESWGGQIKGNQSAGINAAYDQIANWLGDKRRVIGYGNKGDLDSLWPQKPEGIRLVVAGYGANPSYPGKIAHQYTNGEGYGGGLPEGASPFGNCDMNSADGLTATAFAQALGITTTQGDDMALVPQDQWDRVFTEQTQEHPSRSPLRHLGEGKVDTWCGIDLNVDGNVHVVVVKALSEVGHQPAIALLAEVAGADPVKYPDRQADAELARLLLDNAARVYPAGIQRFIDSKKAH